MLKPARTVMMSFVSADDATVAVLLLHQLGLSGTDVVSCTPEQMRARTTHALKGVCPSTPQGLQPEWTATQRKLAHEGHSFVLVRASSGPLLQRICRIAAEAHAHTVQPFAARSTPSAPAPSAARHHRPQALEPGPGHAVPA